MCSSISKFLQYEAKKDIFTYNALHPLFINGTGTEPNHKERR